MKHFVHIKVLIVICTLLALSACRKFIALAPPSTRLVSSEVFANDATAQAAVANIYYHCAASGFCSGDLSSITVLTGLASDELDLYTENKDFKEIYSNNILATNMLSTSLWADAYAIIYKANSLIEGLEKSKEVTAKTKDLLTGEALFIRAFIHFNLYSLFGDIPYIKTTDYQENSKVLRKPKHEIFALMISDLKKAQELLPENYSLYQDERIDANKWAATALLARTYLYMEDWTNAKLQASVLIGQSLYKLTDADAVFLKNSTEAIWQLKPVQQYLNTNEGSIFILDSRPESIALRKDLVLDFEPGDRRKTSWIGEYTAGIEHWYYPAKYKIKLGAEPLQEYSMVLRLAEQYLIRAEALTKLNYLDDAIEDIDIIRLRAGLKKISEKIPQISKENLLSEIAHQRRMELFSEWGHRWFDLKRTGSIDEVMKLKKNNWQHTDALFPIPDSEIKINRNLSQNEGYD